MLKWLKCRGSGGVRWFVACTLGRLFDLCRSHFRLVSIGAFKLRFLPALSSCAFYRCFQDSMCFKASDFDLPCNLVCECVGSSCPFFSSCFNEG